MKKIKSKVLIAVLSAVMAIGVFTGVGKMEVKAEGGFTAEVTNNVPHSTATLSKTSGIASGETIELNIQYEDGYISNGQPKITVTSGSGTISGYTNVSYNGQKITISNITSSIVITAEEKVSGQVGSMFLMKTSETVPLTDITSVNKDYAVFYDDKGEDGNKVVMYVDDEPIDSAIFAVDGTQIFKFSSLRGMAPGGIRYKIEDGDILLYLYSVAPAPLPTPSGSCGSSAPAPEKKLESTNYAGAVLDSWEAVNKALAALEEPQLVPGESQAGTAPLLKVDISSTDKIIQKTTQDVIKDENKGLHVHLGDGFAITMLGKNMANDNQDINAEFTTSDTVNGENKERTLDFTNKGDLTMDVIMHAYLPESVAGNTATIYVENADGTRTQVAVVNITDQNRICWSANSLQKYVIVY